jgi:asparagine synthase (glutamine-hydrolysing)
MSVQFGRWNFNGEPPRRDELERIDNILTPYGPDGGNTYSASGIHIRYRAFHTTQESRQEFQPHLTLSGEVVTWDGRLDNREELVIALGNRSSLHHPDVEIAAAAYERWGLDCFAKLIGDWALSICNPHAQTLILAKDPLGARHLYYSTEDGRLTWSTILEPIVLFAGRTLSLCGEYIAGSFSSFPATHLTPYLEIQSVPPSCFVQLGNGKQYIRKYWDFDPENRIRYCSDADYEEHFRTLFVESIRRRLRSDSPVLAELSGGMDSSSIVCVADKVIGHGRAGTSRLDTLSYYDDAEPNWNERPYFNKIEEKRGRTGCHIYLDPGEFFNLAFPRDRFMPTPSSALSLTEFAKQTVRCMTSQNNRVVLSGIGGDEVTGGVPDATSELADLLASLQTKRFAHQLKMWSLDKRKPWLHLFAETAREFFPPSLVGVPRQRRPARWVHPDFVRRYRDALLGYEGKLTLFGALPSFQKNMFTLEALRRQLARSALSLYPPHEKRYPYLDRSLLEFLYAIPREQLVRPGQRRSLMRRALVGIVPDEILQRKRKAFVVRGPMTVLSERWNSLVPMSQHMITAALHVVEPRRFCDALNRAKHGQEVSIVAIVRTLILESWLRDLATRNVVYTPQQGWEATSRNE